MSKGRFPGFLINQWGLHLTCRRRVITALNSSADNVATSSLPVSCCSPLSRVSPYVIAAVDVHSVKIQVPELADRCWCGSRSLPDYAVMIWEEVILGGGHFVLVDSDTVIMMYYNVHSLTNK